jgi:hypothetical protein
MAEIYLLSPVAYKYGLHIEPVSYGQYNSFIHMRVGTFPAEGYPSIDRGREHLEFLRKIYLRCKPWKAETLDDIGHGLTTAHRMIEAFATVKERLKDGDEAREIGQRLEMTRSLIQTNRAYVATMFAYFDYLDAPTKEHFEVLREAYEDLVQTRAAFMAAPGFGYQLFGVNVIADRAGEMLDDPDAARLALKSAPSREQVEATITAQQQRYAEVLEEYADEAVKIAHVVAQVDGRDILIIAGQEYEVKHLRWDGAHVEVSEFDAPLPQTGGTVVPRDIESRPMHPFVLEQPSAENEHTARIYLYDEPGGHGRMEFDLYYIDESPEKLGLAIPW